MGRNREFSDFVAERRTALLQTAFMLTGERAAAEDLVQNALLQSCPQNATHGPPIRCPLTSTEGRPARRNLRDGAGV